MKILMNSSVFLFLVCSEIHFHLSSGLLPFLCQEQDNSFLLQFKQTISLSATCQSSADISSWNLGTDCCSWDGVECNSTTGHVIGLKLSNSCLAGSIGSAAATLFRLTHLARLNLGSNNFSGQIPPEILSLSDLAWLDLSGNPLQLREPGLNEFVENFPNLIELDLNFVDISSTVPQSFANLSSLVALHLREYNLQGELPAGIFHLPNLRSLVLMLNPNLTGKLPEFLAGSPMELLRVEETGISGEIPESIGNLKSLNNFVAAECNFSGQIPISIGNLQNLETLDLSSNSFTGMIPSSMANLNKLTYLSLSNNKFDPRDLNWVRNLTNLVQLHLTKTNIYGEIPSWLGNFTQLRWINLGSNSLSGPIPDSIFRLPYLEFLSLYSNRLTGSLSSDLFLNSSTLFGLQLSDNNLTLMSTPNSSNSNSTLPKFGYLGLGSCQLREFPLFLQGQDRLEVLDLSQNKISGLVPLWVSKLATESLKILTLGSNSLTSFEKSFNVLPWNSLLVLNLTANLLEGPLPIPPPSIFIYIASGNKFSGEIPREFCNLSTILALDLSKNKLSGKLPHCLGSNLSSSVVALDLRSNNLSGEIPDVFKSHCSLKMLDLSQNKLHGTIPGSLANCSKLESLDLGENRITDLFPHWLGVFPELKVLILRSNKLNGEIEKPDNVSLRFSKLRIIDLSYNNLTGKLPSEYFENWVAMRTDDRSVIPIYLQADISFHTNEDSWTNHFSYAITITYKGAKQTYERILEIFTAVDFSSNGFKGDIPETIGDLTQIQLLNLSGNVLTGHIPSSLANLKVIEALDLSRNRLSGEIPNQLATNLTFLSVFNVSYNNLVGSVPQGFQFNTFENDSFFGNIGLCGVPLSNRCGDTFPTQEGESSSDSTELEFGWKAVLIGYGCGFAITIIVGCIVYTKKRSWYTKKLAS